MTQNEVFEFINNNMAGTLATCIDNKPHVRGMWMYRANEKGIIFHTGTMRDLYKQLQVNPNIELCFYNSEPENLMQIRVSGTALQENDESLREEIIANRPFLQPIADKHGKDSIAVFRVKDMMASVWTMAKNLDPKEYIAIK